MSLPLTQRSNTISYASLLWDYFQLTKPRVMSLVVFSSLVGIILTPTIVPLQDMCWISFVIFCGAGAAGAFNMWYERDIDKKMIRTRSRPIPQGKISPINALIFSLSLGIFALISICQYNLISGLLLLASMIIYCVLYTIIIKKNTPQNIVIGGISGALPPLISSMAVDPQWHLEPILLVIIIFLWTPPHFWALALSCTKDYEKAGIPMLPNVYGWKKTTQHIFLYSIILSVTSFIPYCLGWQNWIYGISALILGGLFLYKSLKLHYSQNSKHGLSLFFYSIIYLFLLMIFMVIGKI